MSTSITLTLNILVEDESEGTEQPEPLVSARVRVNGQEAKDKSFVVMLDTDNGPLLIEDLKTFTPLAALRAAQLLSSSAFSINHKVIDYLERSLENEQDTPEQAVTA